MKSARKACEDKTIRLELLRKQFNNYTIGDLVYILNLSIYLLITAEDESIDSKYTVELIIVY